jgi:hypothetical protein
MAFLWCLDIHILFYRCKGALTDMEGITTLEVLDIDFV